MLDRALIYYSHIINRPHGKRDMAEGGPSADDGKLGITSGLTQSQRAVCARYFKAVTGRSLLKEQKNIQAFEALMESILAKMSGI